MKVLFVLCAVVLFANAYPTQQNENEFGGLLGLTSRGPAELKCLEEAWRKIEKENPQLEGWFKDVEKSVEDLKKQAESCEAITAPVNAIKCYIELSTKAKSEFERLLKALPEEDRDTILEKLRTAIQGCINTFSALLGLTSKKPAEMECVEKAWQKIAEENPKLDWWFKDLEKTSADLQKQMETCQAISAPVDEIKCLSELGAKAKSESERLLKALPEEDRDAILKQLRGAVEGCVNNKFTALLGLTRDAPEQLRCIQDAWNKIEKENPKLDWWFKDVEKSVDGLKKQVEVCKAITNPIDAIKCYIEFSAKAKSEFERWMKSLPEEDRDAILEKLRTAMRGCVNNFAAMLGLTRDTPEQLRCMQDAWIKIEKENPNLDWWFKDVEKSVEGLKKEAEDCKAIDKPIKAIGCYLKMAMHTKEEYERWMNALSDEDKQAILGKLRTAATECINNNP